MAEVVRPRPRRVGRRAVVAWLAVGCGHLGAADTCWVEGFSRELCCGPEHGPEGNAACWDDRFQYDPCCTTGERREAASGEAAMLERSIGGQLDRLLADNNATLPELEEDLRPTISAPENRSVAEPLTLALFALILYRQGRAAEAASELKRCLANDFAINSNGIWVGPAAEGYHMHDVPFSGALVDFLRARGARGLVDFGCGLGLYVRDIRAAGIRAGGFDGNPSTAELTAGRCQQLDLSQEVDFGTRWDWALSLEVAEHIPRELEANFVGNLDRHACRGLVLSWGNQAGEGHVNLRPLAEVEALFAARGFRSDAAAAAAMRQAARLPWLQGTVLVLERETLPPECGR